MIGTDAFREVDTYGISIPITSTNHLVRDIRELPGDRRRVPHRRVRPPGPVWIDVPKDADRHHHPGGAAADRRGGRRTELDPALVSQAAAMINRAKRPILYPGGGICADAHRQALELAERRSAYHHDADGAGGDAGEHPPSLGMLGMHAARSTNFILQEADLLIVLGARFDDRAIGKTEQFCPNAAIIHVDIDRAEQGQQANVAIHADVGQVLQQLLPQIDTQPRSAWLSTVNDLKREFPFNAERRRSAHYAARCVDDSAIITTDVGQQMWVAAYPLSRPRQWLTSGGLGTMGFGLPAAIGAALAEPERSAVLLRRRQPDDEHSGNGHRSRTRSGRENHFDEQPALGLVHQQTLFYQQRIFAAAYPKRTDFLKIAAGFGLDTCDLNAAEDPQAALAEAIQRPGPLPDPRADRHQRKCSRWCRRAPPTST